MEYHSPLSYNFKLKESLLKQEEKQNDSKNRSLPNYVSLYSDAHTKTFPFETSNKKKSSCFDGNGNHDSYNRSTWNSPNERNKVSGIRIYCPCYNNLSFALNFEWKTCLTVPTLKNCTILSLSDLF